MSTRMRFLVPAVAAAGLLLAAAGPTFAARVVSTTLTGQVTALSGGQYITIDGQTYQIAPGSPAATAISQVTLGENVDVTFDGPVASSSSHIVTISAHQGS